MLNKRIVCFLCSVLLILGLCASCDGVDTPSNETESMYWQLVHIESEDIGENEFWGDLFIWEDGSAHFRFSQTTTEGMFYGIHESHACDVAIVDKSVVTLFEQGTDTTIATGTITDGTLHLRYLAYDALLEMEAAEMPVYGSQWDLLDVYGTWRMISYSDGSGAYSGEDLSSYIAAEITLDRVMGNHLWIAVPDEATTMLHSYMDMGRYEGETWHPYTYEAIWDGAANEAWYVALTLDDAPSVSIRLSYANDKVLLSKEDAAHPGVFPYSFTAEFAYVGYREEFGDGDSFKVLSTRYGKAAYGTLLDHMRLELQEGMDAEEIASSIVSFVEEDFAIGNQTSSNNLRYAILEPLQAKLPLGYALRDINADGEPELFILSEDDYTNDSVIAALFTLLDGKPTLVGAYWSRNRCYVDDKGIVYVNGSSGAEDSFSESYTLDAATGTLQLKESFAEYYRPEGSNKQAGVAYVPLLDDAR